MLIGPPPSGGEMKRSARVRQATRLFVQASAVAACLGIGGLSVGYANASFTDVAQVGASTAAGVPRPTTGAVLRAVVAALGADEWSAVRGARACAPARGADVDADSEAVDPSDPESARATAGADATQAPIPNATAKAPTRPT